MLILYENKLIFLIVNLYIIRDSNLISAPAVTFWEADRHFWFLWESEGFFVGGGWFILVCSSTFSVYLAKECMMWNWTHTFK